MRQILDLHLHSRYSRACSPQLTLANLDRVGRAKGVDIIATGDFTYPDWFSSIETELEEINTGVGLYKLKNSDGKIKFILSTEVALIYKDNERVRRIHLVIHAPNRAAVKKLNTYLDAHYNIRSDGRPILGIKAPELVKLCLSIDPKFLIYPAHIWTPWFSVFGSKSGFDTLEECFKEQTKNIYAYETGLSSDPVMNWRLSALDNLTCLSNSDAHSLDNIGREANIFELKEISYPEIYRVIKEKDLAALKGTIEFYPEEGMYHFDGHRDCNFSCLPELSRKNKNICPICKKPLVIGVLNRVEELADRPEGFTPVGAVGFKKLVELDKIIAEVLGIKSRKSKNVQLEYNQLIKQFGSELSILLDLDLSLTGLEEKIDSRILEGIKRVREGRLIIKPGFDGRYGEVKIFSTPEESKRQQSLL
ncbi:MAG: endonuclease Q family protein [Candidatus Falkowbacteria bacterium]|nr:endonuclease Q family protein [Candidatus Falkowbacteria bacterium]